MKLLADAHIELPFKIDLCARGPDVEPLTCTLGDTQVTLFFPPSLGEGTDGQGIFGEWAWWTGRSLRLVLDRDVAEIGDVEALRAAALATGNMILRRFLNAYRWRFGKPNVHPVTLDPRTLTLEVVRDDGRKQALEEPFAAFFYRNRPAEPPLGTSINTETLPLLQNDVQSGTEPALAAQLRLDADALETQGETERAEWIRGLLTRA